MREQVFEENANVKIDWIGDVYDPTGVLFRFLEMFEL